MTVGSLAAMKDAYTVELLSAVDLVEKTVLEKVYE